MFKALRGGMGELVAAIEHRLPPAASGCESARAIRDANAVTVAWRVDMRGGDDRRARGHPRGAGARGRATARRSPIRVLADLCAEVPYVSTVSVALAWPRATCRASARRQRLRRGARAQPAAHHGVHMGLVEMGGPRASGKVLLRAFLGGASDPEAVAAVRRRSSSDRRARPASVLGASGAADARAGPPLAARRRAAQRRPSARARRASTRGSPRCPGCSSPAAASESIGVPDCVADGRAAAPPRRRDYVGLRSKRDDAARVLRIMAHAGIARSLALRVRIAIALAVAARADASTHAQSPEVQKVLADIKAQDKGQLAVSEEDGRFLRVLIATSKAKRALEIGGASGYSAIWMGMGLRETGGKLVTIEYDPVRAKELAENIKRAGLVRHRDGRRRRRVRADADAVGLVRLRVSRRVEEGLQAVPRPDAAAPGQGRPVRRPQRREQAERDGRLPRRDPEDTRALDDDRVAVGRRDVGVGEEVGRSERGVVRGRSDAHDGASVFFGARFLRGLPLRRPAGTARRSARASTCWSGTS